MADRVITAEAILTAKDATGDVFAKVAGKFQQLGKGAKVSADVERMAKSIEQANSQLRALDKLQSSRGGFADARTKFNAQKVAVEQAAKALKEAEKPTRALKEAYAKAQAEVVKASTAFERSKTAMLDAKHAAEGFGTPLARVAEQQARLRGVIDSTTRAIEHQSNAEMRAAEAHTKAEKAAERRREGIRHHGIVNYALGSAAAAVSAHSIMSGVEKTIHAGAEYQHEVVGLQNAGRTPEQIAEIQQRSSEVVHRLPTSTYLENMKVVSETTQAFGSVEHAMEHLEFMQKAMSVLKASGGEHIKGTAGDVGRAFAKTFEERFTRPENFEKEASAMIPAMVASGGVFNPESLYAFAQQAKGSLPNYSMRFLSRIAPSLIGAQGGDRAGTAANAFTSIVMGKVNDKKQAEEWERYGLLDEKQVIKKSGNVVSWRAGAVKNTALALSDPLQWAETVALPAMAAKGVKIDDRQALSIALGTMFRNQNGNMFANEIMQADSRSRLHKDEALTNQVGSTDDIYKRNLTADPNVGLQAFNASLENLMTTVSGPAMGTIASGLSGLASGINDLANVLKDHPALAMTAGAATGVAALGGAGYASYQLMNGFGLGGSATALEGSATALGGAATALDAAAAKLGAGSAASGVAGAAGKGLPGELDAVKPGDALPKARMLGAGGMRGLAGTVGEGVVGALLYEGGTRGITWALDHLPHGKYPAGYDPQAIRNGGVSGDLQRLFGDFQGGGSGGGGRGRLPQGTPNWQKPGHWAFGRGGSKQWIPDQLPPGTAVPGPVHPALAGGGDRAAATSHSGPIDVTGKVQADVKTNVDVRFKLDVPAGFGVTKTFQSTVTTGSTMPTAAKASNSSLYSAYDK